MKNRVMLLQDVFLLRLHKMERWTLCMHLCLYVLLLASAWCFVRSFSGGAPAFSQGQPLAPPKEGAVHADIAKITKAAGLRQDSIARARASLTASAGRDPFLHEAETAPEESPAVYQEPPAVKIRGLLLGGEVRGALLEIGDASGAEYFQAGASFDEGRGKIIAIDGEGVSWRWEGTVYRTVISSL